MNNRLCTMIILMFVYSCTTIKQETGSSFVSVTDYGATGDDRTDDLVAVRLALAQALATGKNLYFPSGTYILSSYFPIRNKERNGLKDYQGITVFGDGNSTKIITSREICFDVLQLNAVKNVRFKDFSIGAECDLNRSKHGANGVSLTGGSQNISFERIVCTDLPFLEKEKFFDGGSAFSIQPGNAKFRVDSISFLECEAKNCVYGFGIDLPGQYYWKGNLGSVAFVDGKIENCMRGVSIGSSNTIGKGEVNLDRTRILIKGNKFRNCEISILGSRLATIDIENNSFRSKNNGFDGKEASIGHLFLREVEDALLKENSFKCKSCLSKEYIIRSGDTFKNVKKKLKAKKAIKELR